METRQQYRIEADGIEGIDDVTTGINEVVVQRLTPDDPVGRKITRLEVMADDEYVGEFVGTGLSVSTPTGSTGLSLSAGGPVHYPKNNSTLQLVPLHTHNVGVRPLVVSGSTEITIGVEDPASVLVDGGRAHASLEPGDVLTVTSAEKPANFVSTSYNRPFFRSLSESLGWGIRTSDDSPDTLESGGSGSVQEGDDGSGDTVSRAIRVATEAAKGAGEPLRELGGKVESIQFKTDKSDIVTEADYQSEHIITTVVENEFPDHSVRSEEDVQLEGDSEYTWLVDPLDGTGNFAHGNPNYAVSIGLLKSNTPVAGVVYAPETDDLFYARRGGMAYQNGQPITTTDRDRLDESMLLSGYDPDGSFISHYYQRTRGVRRSSPRRTPKTPQERRGSQRVAQKSPTRNFILRRRHLRITWSATIRCHPRGIPCPTPNVFLWL
ncbi:MAG: inositol monophosphatase family protein [Halobacteria archaeon]|nr:inositol monophosphatase family protein [Halobacteria archaeon]